MTNIDHAAMHLANMLITVFDDMPGGQIQRDCREAILDAYDRLRERYNHTENDGAKTTEPKGA